MITRVAQLRIDPARAEDAVALVRADLAPAVLAQAGAEAGRWMVEPDSGDVVTMVRWSDEDALFAAATELTAVRDRMVTELRATPVSMQVHDVIGVAIDQPLSLGVEAWSHVVRLAGLDESARPDAAALFRIFADEHRGKPGFLGVTWSADFTASSGLCVSTWDSAAALDDDGTRAAALWPEIERALSARISSAGHYRTLGMTPTEHVLDLTPFDRVASRLAI